MRVLSSNRPDTLNLSINYGFSNLPIHDCEAVLKAPVSRGTGWVTITYFMTKLRAFTGTQIWPSSSPLHNVSSCDKLPWLALDRHVDTYPNATDYMPCHVGRLHGKRVLVSTQHPSPSPYKGHIIWSALLSSIHKSQNHTQPKLSFHFHFLVSISLSKVSFISPFLRRTIAGKIKALPWINGGFSDRSLFGLSKRKRHVLLSSRVLVTLTEVGNPKQKRLYLAQFRSYSMLCLANQRQNSL